MAGGQANRATSPDQGADQPQYGHAGYVTPDEQASRDVEQVQAVFGAPGPFAGIYQAANMLQDASTNAAVAGGSFKMDIDAMRSLLPDWEAVADQLRRMVSTARTLPGLQPPAEDMGSQIQIEAARTHAQAYLDSLQDQLTYAQGYANQLKKAISDYETREQANLDHLRKRG